MWKWRFLFIPANLAQAFKCRLITDWLGRSANTNAFESEQPRSGRYPDAFEGRGKETGFDVFLITKETDSLPPQSEMLFQRRLSKSEMRSPLKQQKRNALRMFSRLYGVDSSIATSSRVRNPRVAGGSVILSVESSSVQGLFLMYSIRKALPRIFPRSQK